MWDVRRGEGNVGWREGEGSAPEDENFSCQWLWAEIRRENEGKGRRDGGGRSTESTSAASGRGSHGPRTVEGMRVRGTVDGMRVRGARFNCGLCQRM
eukprot:363412-Chlamydomonas_euryale.AAC.2